MATESRIKVVADTSQAERALGNLNSMLKGLVTAGALTSMAKFADSITNLQNKLSLVTQEGQSADEAFKIMAKSAINLGAPLKDVGDLFFRVANNTKDLGLAQKDQVAITETLIKGFQLTGQTMGETAGAITQLGQAFSQGVLRGDELNSVLEALPMVADALAEKFGVQRGALKALGEQGKITSKDLSDAILASGESIDKAWGNRIPTIAQSFSTLQTALAVAFQQFDKSTGTSQAFSLALIKIANSLITVIDFFEKWGAVIAAVAEIFLIGKLYKALKTIMTPVLALVAGFGDFRNTLIAMTAPLVNMTGWWAKLVGFFEIIVGNFFPNMVSKGNAVIAVLAGIASFLGVTALFDAIGGLFSKDERDAAAKYKDEVDKLNKSLGIDNVQASDQARKASEGLTAQQLRDAEAIRKATQSRDIELKKITQTLNDSLAVTSEIGDQETIESYILQTNRNLIKEILNDKGQIIGYTQGLNDKEEIQLRLLKEQEIALKAQQSLRAAMSSTEPMGAMAGRAANIFGGTSQGIQVEYERQKAALDYLNQQKGISEQEFADQSILIEQQRSQALINLEQQTAESRMRINGVVNQQIIDAVKSQMESVKMMQQGGIAGAQGLLGSMIGIFGALGQHNKKAFETYKALAVAQAVISTYQAAAMAIAMPPGPPISFLYVAGAVAAGMAQVAAIRSQQYSGRALGGPVMGNSPYIVGENGPELFTPNTSGRITRNDQLGSGGPVNVNFTIVANDTTGFDTLLATRKGMIKQMISDAMLEKGQRF